MADENMKEKISALMDGEMGVQDMQASFREMRASDEHQVCWDHYHLIGDALRNGLPRHIDTSFASRVSQAIAEENTPVSPPQSVKPAKSVNKRRAVPRPVVGFAMAASVAAVAYLGVGMIAVEEQAMMPRVAAVAPSTELPLTRQNHPVSGLQTAQGKHWTEAKPSVESRLNNYLQNHQNLSTTAAMNGYMLPPARLVVIPPRSGE